MEASYAALNTLIRVHETERLTRTHYEQLLAANDYEMAVRTLIDTPYREGTEQAILTGDYEMMVMNHLCQTYQWVIDSGPDKRLVELVTLRYSYHNIKVMFKEIVTGKNFESTLIEIGAFPLYELRRAVVSGESDVLGKYYLQNIRNLRDQFEEASRLAEVDVFLDRAYTHHLKRLVEELDNEYITTYVTQLIDYRNLQILLRAIERNRGVNHLRATLTDEGNVAVEDLIAYWEQDYDSVVMNIGQTSAFKDVIEHAWELQKVAPSDTLRPSKEQKSRQQANHLLRSNPLKLELRYLEQAVAITLASQLSEASFQVFGPLPVWAFLESKEVEVSNIRLALAGKINDIPIDIVRSRMRLDYAV